MQCLHSAEHLYDRTNPMELGAGIFSLAISVYYASKNFRILSERNNRDA
jgi:hypothetical protein